MGWEQEERGGNDNYSNNGNQKKKTKNIWLFISQLMHFLANKCWHFVIKFPLSAKTEQHIAM